jgi:hypothetical protein
VSDLREIDRHPIHAWINVSSKGLEALRLALICHHRDAFEEDPLRSFDPSSWMARAVAENIAVLIHSMGLYEQAAQRPQAEDVEF